MLRVEPRMIVLTVAGVITATAAATLMNGFAGASETKNETNSGTGVPGPQAPATAAAGIPQPAVRPATTWYSDWSSFGSGSSGTNCDPMALRWC
jgi:hypothetical protein